MNHRTLINRLLATQKPINHEKVLPVNHFQLHQRAAATYLAPKNPPFTNKSAAIKHAKITRTNSYWNWHTLGSITCYCFSNGWLRWLPTCVCLVSGLFGIIVRPLTIIHVKCCPHCEMNWHTIPVVRTHILLVYGKDSITNSIRIQNGPSGGDCFPRKNHPKRYQITIKMADYLKLAMKQCIHC